MVWVRFWSDFDFRPTRNIVVAYKAGYAGSVRRLCRDQAMAADKAVEIPTPRRGEVPDAGATTKRV